MTTTKSLEQLFEIETKMPGIIKKISEITQGGATWGMHWIPQATDSKYLETDKYCIYATKIDKHQWSEDGGGIEWSGRLTLFYKSKDADTLKRIDTERIVTRDKYDSKNDKTSLWRFEYVGITALCDDKIKASWLDSEGKEGPTYELKLE